MRSRLVGLIAMLALLLLPGTLVAQDRLAFVRATPVTTAEDRPSKPNALPPSVPLAQDAGDRIDMAWVLIGSLVGVGSGYFSCGTPEKREDNVLCEDSLGESLGVHALIGGLIGILLSLGFSPDEISDELVGFKVYDDGVVGVGFAVALP